MEFDLTGPELDLSYNRIRNEGLKLLAEELKQNRTIKILNLYGNIIRTEGARVIADILKHNRTIQELDLFNSRIKAEGARLLADALKQNNTLQKLYLSENEIGEEGARFLADALKQNNTLQVLDLRVNGIKNEGVRFLAEALKQNNTLQVLNLVQNRITDEGARFLIDALVSNSALQELNLRYNPIENKLRNQIYDLLDRNKKIQKQIREISDMILTSTQFELGGKPLPRDMRRLLSSYVLETSGRWLRKEPSFYKFREEFNPVFGTGSDARYNAIIETFYHLFSNLNNKITRKKNYFETPEGRKLGLKLETQIKKFDPNRFEGPEDEKERLIELKKVYDQFKIPPKRTLLTSLKDIYKKYFPFQ